MNIFKVIIQKKDIWLENALKKFWGYFLEKLPVAWRAYLTNPGAKFNLPNNLSYLRGVLCVPTFYTLVEGYYGFALLLILVGALLDLIDGPTARALKCVSKFGKLLDPVMDKIFIFSCLFSLTPYLNIYYLSTMAFFELALVTYTIFLLISGKKIRGANIFGKYKMNVQTGLIFLIILGGQNPAVVIIINYLLPIATTLTIASFLGHLRK